MRALVARLRMYPNASEVLRYLVAGTAITLTAHLIYLGGLGFDLTPSLSWFLSFLCGIALGYVVHHRYVFRTERQRHHWITFPAAYLLRFAIGEIELWFCLALGLSPGWAGFVTNVSMAPLGFVLLRLVLKGEAFAIHREKGERGSKPSSTLRSGWTGLRRHR
jgi:putative flippase GtrA